MSSLKSTSQPDDRLEPESLDRFFLPEQQRTYMAMLVGRGGLTRRRTECFVRLWAYLFLKQQQELGKRLSPPLTQLNLPEGMVACTHREAAELFYGNQERGSDRAAGMMIDRFVALGLLEKRFDGQTLCLQIRTIPELVSPIKQEETVDLFADSFNPRTDAIPIANLFTRNYAELIKDPGTASHKVTRSLRAWSQQYPMGMRVMRRSDNRNPVAIAIFYPVTSESEVHFFQSPGKSFFLSAETPVDPFQMATPGDVNCTSINIRAWFMDTPYLQKPNLLAFLEDSRKTLMQMQQEDFPNLCDIYSVIVHPLYEDLRVALGFQKTIQDPQRSYHWVYLGLDRLIETDFEQALSSMRQNLANKKPG